MHRDAATAEAETVLPRIGRMSPAVATAVCAVVFFLASADKLFTLHVPSVNVRYANFALVVALLAWIVRRARHIDGDARWLAFAWLPFVVTYGVAAVTSAHWVSATVKLGWFAFSFIAAYAWTTFFDGRDVARAYFLSYLAVAAIIVIDFVNGFSLGPGHMIGFGQVNDMVDGTVVFRPHAFYYEPSFAASSLGLAWALAMTPMRDAAPRLALALVVAGAIALVVMTSRTGWLFAAVAAVAILVFNARSRHSFGRKEVRRLAGLAAAGAALLFAVIAASGHPDAFEGLLGRLGVVQAFQRVCPLLAERYSIDLNCLSSDERRRLLGESQVDPDETTEGSRLAALRAAAATVARHPLLGVGAYPGEHHLIAPPIAPNMWLEIGVDGGLLSLLAFAFGIACTLYRWRAFEPRHRSILIVLVLWLCVAWQFIATFPRLDLWIAFWAVLAWMRAQPDEKRVVLRGREMDVKGFGPLDIATQ